jgi:hypothetical protein
MRQFVPIAAKMVQVQLSTFPQRAIFHNFQKLQIRMAAGNGGQASVLRPDCRDFGRNLLYSARNSFTVESLQVRLYLNARQVLY